jgi:hypothetical protein
MRRLGNARAALAALSALDRAQLAPEAAALAAQIDAEARAALGGDVGSATNTAGRGGGA